MEMIYEINQVMSKSTAAVKLATKLILHAFAQHHCAATKSAQNVIPSIWRHYENYSYRDRILFKFWVLKSFLLNRKQPLNRSRQSHRIPFTETIL